MLLRDGQVRVGQAAAADVAHVAGVDYQAMVDAIVVGDSVKGLQFAFLGALAVVEVEETQIVVGGGDGGGHAAVEATADQDDGAGHGGASGGGLGVKM